MNGLRKFFDHLHAHEEIGTIKTHFLVSLGISVFMVLLVAPLPATVVCLFLLSLSLICNGFGVKVPLFFGYGLGIFFLIGLHTILPGGFYSSEFIASFFTVMAIAQSFVLRRYWHGEILLIWLLACNTATSLLDGSATLSVWIVVVMFFNLGQMLRLHLKNFSLATLTTSLRSAARTAAYALPMLFIFIYVFQKSYETRHHFSDNSVIGIGRILEPGKVSKLSMRSGVAYRIATNRPIPEISDIYWRVATLARSDGLNWSLSGRGSKSSGISGSSGTEIPKGCEIIQTVYGQEYDTKNILAALDRPLDIFTLRQTPPTVRSNICSGLKEKALSNYERTLFLKTENPPSPKIKALLSGLTNGARSPSAIADRIISYFVSQKFTYTLTPRKIEAGDPLEGFLFVTREGYCEHFAAATGSLLRMAGVPSRVVVGFQGGTYNRFGGYWLVSYGDAHAWTEYWDDSQWRRMDPTAILAPNQMRRSGQPKNFLSVFERLPFLGSLWENLWLSLDEVLFFFQRFFSGKGRLMSLTDVTLDPFLALGSLLFLFIILQVQKGWQPIEKSVRDHFNSLCLLWAGQGMRRERHEGYESYRRRLVEWMEKNERLCKHVDSVNELFLSYEDFRYGPSALSSEELKDLVKMIKRVRRYVRSSIGFHFTWSSPR